MTTVKYYQNNRNGNKFLEVHNDGFYHNSVRQFLFWAHLKKGVLLSSTLNYTGDAVLHRWKKSNLDELLKDYTETKSPFEGRN